MAEQSLKSKTVKGASWSFLDNIANQGITFLVGLILARMLSPKEYGLIGIITIFISVSNTIVNSGFSNALIRKTDADEKDYSTGFITNFLFSIIVFIILFVAAPFIASFFDEPLLSPLLKVMGVIVIINAFAIIQRTILTIRLDFKTQTKVSLISSLASGTIGIGMAATDYGVWSLVGQQISRQLLNTIFLWVYSHWIPRLIFSIKSFKEMWSFGWKLLVSSLISTLWNEVYQIVIGKCYSTATLGQFTRASQFSQICSQNLTGIVQRVTYPVLSSIKDDKERLKQAYKKIIKSTMLISFCLMLGMAGCAESIILSLVGPQWTECIPMLQVICLYMMFYPLHALNLNMLQVAGRSDLFLRLEIIKKIVGLVPLLLGIFVGIYWMLISSVVTDIISYYLNAYYSGTFVNYTFKEQVKDILPSFGVSMAMAIIVYGIGWLPLPCFVILPIQLIVGVSFVIYVYEKLQLEEYNEIKQMAIPFIRKYRLKS